MTEHKTELSRSLVVGHKRDGRCRYDPAAKRELIEAALRPGVSVAGLALRHGINANLLRTWMRQHQLREMETTSMAPPSAFIPVVPERPTAKVPQGMIVRLPNGVRVELEAVGREEVFLILRTLSELPCSASTLG